MKNSMYGYVRVSTKDQNEARQLIAMQEFGIDEQKCNRRHLAWICKDVTITLSILSVFYKQYVK